MKGSKWRVVKKDGKWVVRQPGGTHLGAYFTWGEAIAQVTSRSRVQGVGAGGGYFDRKSTLFDDYWLPAFGFVDSVRCEEK